MKLKQLVLTCSLMSLIGCQTVKEEPINACQQKPTLLESSNWLDQFTIDRDVIYQASAANQLELNKYDLDGNLLFHKNLEINASDYKWPIEIHAKGDFIYLAYNQKAENAVQYDELSNEFGIHKFSQEGDLIWSHVFSSENILNNSTFSLQQLGNQKGAYVLFSENAPYPDEIEQGVLSKAKIVKLNENGVIEWEKEISGHIALSNSINVFDEHILVDLYYSAHQENPEYNLDGYIGFAKFSLNTKGDLLWAKPSNLYNAISHDYLFKDQKLLNFSNQGSSVLIEELNVMTGEITLLHNIPTESIPHKIRASLGDSNQIYVLVETENGSIQVLKLNAQGNEIQRAYLDPANNIKDFEFPYFVVNDAVNESFQNNEIRIINNDCLEWETL